ncbi:MAG TPA: hypothetical protein VG675_14770 [Bryobacteraceae bacterium]|nr:hypothetical protein [Bryobacteraceae bacterium]
MLFILDEAGGPPGEHLVEQFWHLGDAPHAAAQLAFSKKPETVEGWRSRVFGSKEPASVLLVAHRGSLPAVLAAAVCFDSLPEALTCNPPPRATRQRCGSAMAGIGNQLSADSFQRSALAASSFPG